MTLVVLVTTGALFARYFRGRRVSVHEALFVGLVMDYPMFALAR
jgi:hypothetical protein